MNRREAIAALTALPEVARVSVAKPQPDDVIVVEVPGPLSDECGDRLKEWFERVWPGRMVVILADGIRMKFAPR